MLEKGSCFQLLVSSEEVWSTDTDRRRRHNLRQQGCDFSTRPRPPCQTSRWCAILMRATRPNPPCQETRCA
eukprot:1157624-Pelagomonas_calceolata.AAC.8